MELASGGLRGGNSGVGGGGLPLWLPRGRPVLQVALAASLAVLLVFGSGWRLGRAAGAKQRQWQGQHQLHQQHQHQHQQGADPLLDGAQTGPAPATREGPRGPGGDRGAAGSEGEPPRPGPPRRRSGWCAYGSLPGTWVSGHPHGARWQLLGRGCVLRNLLVKYAAAAAAERAAAAAGNATGALDSGGVVVVGGGSGLKGSGTADASGGASGGGAGGPPAPPPLRVLLLSDSVDRYITAHLCDYLGGSQEAQVPHDAPPAAGGDGGGAGPAGAPGPRRRRRRRRLHAEGAGAEGAAAGAAPPPSGGSPSSVYTTAYSLHKCVTGPWLRVASSYFPGVHPAGPWHRNVTQPAAARVASAAALWRDFAGDEDPDLVSVSSLLWDVARMWFHERHLVEGPELSAEVLEGWAANFTAVVAHARAAFPKARVWATHTTLTPRYHPATGLAAKPYLGRPYYVAQLNGALAAAAGALGLELVDYAQVGARFTPGQGHLLDLIHPNREIGLEIANIYFNLAAQAREQAPSSDAPAGSAGL